MANQPKASASDERGDTREYLERKARFNRCLTIYGRKPVLEALQQTGVRCERLHLAHSNKSAAIIDEILALANKSGAEIRSHTREALSRISRNAREDQGVAADISWDNYRPLDDETLSELTQPGAVLIATDGITNPQNLGMLIRSAAAGRCNGILIPRTGGCDISPLVIKASAGALFRAPIIRFDTTDRALELLQKNGWKIAILDAGGDQSLFDPLDDSPRVFVLGSETDGISQRVRTRANETLSIPMANGIESLNVAVTAALVAFRQP